MWVFFASVVAALFAGLMFGLPLGWYIDGRRKSMVGLPPEFVPREELPRHSIRTQSAEANKGRTTIAHGRIGRHRNPSR